MPSGRLPEGVTLHCRGASLPGTGADIVESLVQSRSGLTGARVVHSCPRCGSARHGRLVVHSATACWASLSRAGELTVVALSAAGPVGVDVELSDVIDGDPAALRRWCAVEAALKATGAGLALDPDAVTLVAGSWAGPASVEVPGAGRLEVVPIDLPGRVGAVAFGLRGVAGPGR